MDEASSKFVDTIVMDKLVSEKLATVHHFPEQEDEELYRKLFEDFKLNVHSDIHITHESSSILRYKSPLLGTYEENNTIPVAIHRTSASQTKANIILVHGLYEENRDIYTFLIQNLTKLGYNVYVTTLPFHYERKPARSAFGGEFFWSANIQRSRFSFQQAVSELHALFKHLKQDGLPTHFTAFSMGGGVTMSLLSLPVSLDKVFLMNPTCSLSAIVWDSPLCKTIKQDLLNYGWSEHKILDVYSYFEPASLLSQKKLSNTAMVYGAYDMITKKDQYLKLIENVSFNKIFEYNCGHLNILRVPKLANDINSFFEN